VASDAANGGFQHVVSDEVAVCQERLDLRPDAPSHRPTGSNSQTRFKAAVEIQLLPHPLPRDQKAISTVGLEYEFRKATVRAQANSTGKVSMLLEKHIVPLFNFSIAGKAANWTMPR
jgi:hypothetical protein